MDKAMDQELMECSVLCNNSPDTMMVLDAMGKILFVCGPFEELSGFKIKDVVGTRIFDLPLIQKEDLPLVKKNFLQRMKGKQILSYRMRVKTKSGKKMTMELNGRLLKFRGVNAVFFIVRDVSHISAMEQELQEEKDRYRNLFNQAPVGIGIATIDGRVIDANKTMEAITGYSLEEFGKYNITRMYARASDREELVKKMKNKGIIENFETDLIKKDGSIYKALLNVRNIEIKGENFLQTTIIDITSFKKTEEELFTKTSLLNAQAETSPDGILAVDHNGKTILVNNRFGKIWGIPKEIIDTKNDELMLKYVLNKLKDPESFLSKVKYLYAHKNETSKDEVEFKDGRVLDRYSAPLINGKRHGRIWYFRDITDRKSVEIKLQEKALEQERINKIMIGRELKMIKLKEEIDALKRRLK